MKMGRKTWESQGLKSNIKKATGTPTWMVPLDEKWGVISPKPLNHYPDMEGDRDGNGMELQRSGLKRGLTVLPNKPYGLGWILSRSYSSWTQA